MHSHYGLHLQKYRRHLAYWNMCTRHTSLHAVSKGALKNSRSKVITVWHPNQPCIKALILELACLHGNLSTDGLTHKHTEAHMHTCTKRSPSCPFPPCYLLPPCLTYQEAQELRFRGEISMYRDYSWAFSLPHFHLGQATSNIHPPTFPLPQPHPHPKGLNTNWT